MVGVSYLWLLKGQGLVRGEICDGVIECVSHLRLLKGQGLVRGLEQGTVTLSSEPNPTNSPAAATNAPFHVASTSTPAVATAIATSFLTDMHTNDGGGDGSGGEGGGPPTKVTSAVYLSSLRVLIGMIDSPLTHPINTTYQHLLHIHILSTHPIIITPPSPVLCLSLSCGVDRRVQ